MKPLKFFIAMFSVAALPLGAQSVVDTNLVVEPLLPVNSLNTPTCMVFVDPTTILVNEKNTGRVRRVVNGTLQADALDLPVNSQSERGLLGIVKHPQFPTVPDVYLYYTVAASDGATPIANRVARFAWNGTTLTNQRIVIDLPYAEGPNHDGGIIKFGPPTVPPDQQKLFIIIGDLNRNGQLENNAAGAAPDNTACVIRLNPDGTIPTGADKGPFYDVAGSNTSLQSLYAYGIRNSFGMDFDPVTGALWDTENGPSDNDEVNRIDPGFNSGWTDYMGLETNVNPANLVQFGGVGTYSNPEFSWVSVVAPTALHFYTGTNLGSQYQNQCFVGANNNQKIYRFALNTARDAFVLSGNLADTVLNQGDSDSPILFGQDFGAIGDIVTGPNGALHVVSIGGRTIYRIRNAATSVDNWQLYE